MNWYKKAQDLKDFKEELYIQSPDPIHNNWGLVFLSENQDKIDKFIKFCQSLPKELNAFWQSGSHIEGNQYPIHQYFELWGSENKHDLILSLIEKLSKILGVEAQIK